MPGPLEKDCPWSRLSRIMATRSGVCTFHHHTGSILMKTSTPLETSSSQPIRRGRLFVLSGPSGVGKGTLCKQLLSALKDQLFWSVSATSRPPRPGEIDGQDYHFVSPERFEQMIADGAFLEWARYGLHAYGSPREPVEARLRAGQSVLMEIDVQGALQVKANAPEARLIFILPPSRQELERRLRGRGTNSEEDIQRRLQIAENELKLQGEFHDQVVNDDLERALNQLIQLVHPENPKD
jgi:guanylate kinase